jgi:hypothetical protein
LPICGTTKGEKVILPSCSAEYLKNLLTSDRVPIAEPIASMRKPEPDRPPALLTMKLILKFYLPLDERTLDRWLSAGKFPPADLAQGRKVRLWKRETVESWIENHHEQS